VAAYAMLALLPAFVSFHECRAGAKDRGKSKKQTAHRRSPEIPDDPGGEGRQTSESKTDHIFVPSAFLERGQFDANDHELSDNELFKTERNKHPNSKG
jgi:hypothetical protein